MREHYNIDRLIEHGCEPIPDTTRVINPHWRALDAQVRHHNAKLNRELASFAAVSLPTDPKAEDVGKWEHRKATLQSAIEQRRQNIETLKSERKAAAKHIALKDLPEEHRFSQLRAEKKHFIDTIRLIAYRAETAMAGLARENMARHDDARSLMRQLYETSIDLLPDPRSKTLTVRLHHLTARVHDKVIASLCQELIATETVFPGTDLRLIFSIARLIVIPVDQDV